MLFLAAEVTTPVVMSPWAVRSIVPAFPAPVLLADILLLGAVISPASILIWPPSPMSDVDAVMSMLSERVMLGLVISMGAGLGVFSYVYSFGLDGYFSGVAFACCFCN